MQRIDTVAVLGWAAPKPLLKTPGQAVWETFGPLTFPTTGVSIYREIKQGYPAALSPAGSPEDPAACLAILAAMLDLHPDLSFVVKTNIRLYFSEKRSLDGLTDWIEPE